MSEDGAKEQPVPKAPVDSAAAPEEAAALPAEATPVVEEAPAAAAVTDTPPATVPEAPAKPETMVAPQPADASASAEQSQAAADGPAPASIPMGPTYIAPAHAAPEPEAAGLVAEPVPALPATPPAGPAPAAAAGPAVSAVPVRRNALALLEFGAWRLAEAVATLMAVWLIVWLCLPSETGTDVAGLFERLGVTLPLLVLAIIVGALLGVPLGAAAAISGRAIDATLRTLLLVGGSLGPIWLGMLLVLLLAGVLGWVRPGGFVPWAQNPMAALSSLLLPVLALGLPLGAEIALRLRYILGDVRNGAAMQLAEVQGVPMVRVFGKIVLRQALAALLPQILVPLALLVPISLVIETVFYLPGLGRMMLGALEARDFGLLQGGLMALAALVVVLHFLVRLAQGALDPRLVRRP